MYYTEEDIEKMDSYSRIENLFEQYGYGRGQIEELEHTVLILRKSLAYICQKLNLSDTELYNLHNGYKNDDGV